jgi:FixJ family two-component response regulator
VSEASHHQASAIVVVADAALASSLEMALQAAGLTAIIHDPAQGLAALPLDIALTLIVDHRVVKPGPAAFVAALRARPWAGLVILMTGDGDTMRAALGAARRTAVLEMPFVGADLIAAIRAAWPADGSQPPGS